MEQDDDLRVHLLEQYILIGEALGKTLYELSEKQTITVEGIVFTLYIFSMIHSLILQKRDSLTFDEVINIADDFLRNTIGGKVFV
jgi:hypothetical protein